MSQSCFFSFHDQPLCRRQLASARFLLVGLLAAFLQAFAAWLWLLAMRLLTFTNRLGRYLTETSYSLYVLHLPVLYLLVRAGRARDRAAETAGGYQNTENARRA